MSITRCFIHSVDSCLYNADMLPYVARAWFDEEPKTDTCEKTWVIAKKVIAPNVERKATLHAKRIKCMLPYPSTAVHTPPGSEEADAGRLVHRQVGGRVAGARDVCAHSHKKGARRHRLLVAAGGACDSIVEPERGKPTMKIGRPPPGMAVGGGGRSLPSAPSSGV